MPLPLLFLRSPNTLSENPKPFLETDLSYDFSFTLKPSSKLVLRCLWFLLMGNFLEKPASTSFMKPTFSHSIEVN
jgi:hypothetical protein